MIYLHLFANYVIWDGQTWCIKWVGRSIGMDDRCKAVLYLLLCKKNSRVNSRKAKMGEVLSPMFTEPLKGNWIFFNRLHLYLLLFCMKFGIVANNFLLAANFLVVTVWSQCCSLKLNSEKKNTMSGSKLSFSVCCPEFKYGIRS